ncbi:hypothetical protein C6X95_14890 [Bacillus pumilus]|uniref:YfzA family protein n=1 Tax=Bacillus TaxID=1386 RepID=UPI000D040E1C|nr:YfzA family protein [Bacillus pumilus]MDR6749031.1 hypothetical protein [Bacillus pumilus]PRS12108.1 hypothetical protein C6X95_14890 [Bacillus pumilus]PRS32109.1 hypothetical protein C6X96_12700 [Bacillus pumilus]
MDKKNSQRSLIKRSWFHTFLAFIASQLYIMFVERTGIGPNMRGINGTFIENIVDLDLYQRYFTFYETPWYNMFTIFFGAITIIHMTTGIMKDIRNG